MKEKEIFSREGVFVEFKEKEVELENGQRLKHRSEEPTKLWWELKEAIKGKKVRIVAYEVGEGE
jgi:hypothetical protein